MFVLLPYKANKGVIAGRKTEIFFVTHNMIYTKLFNNFISLSEGKIWYQLNTRKPKTSFYHIRWW